jgi:hypothetical protein
LLRCNRKLSALDKPPHREHIRKATAQRWEGMGA